MGNALTQRVSFEDVEDAQRGSGVIISVLPETEQEVLIFKTVAIADEIEAVEAAIKQRVPILIYGRNSNDEKVYPKYDQILKLGGTPYVYSGGLFEWLTLQDIYGDAFRTTARCLDILKYRPRKILNTKYLTYYGRGTA